MWAKPLKDIAHKLVNEAIRKGELTRQPCERCGSETGVVAHHEDYYKPLDIMWLCRSHHGIRHQELGWGIPEYQRMAKLIREEESAPKALFASEGQLHKALFTQDGLQDLFDGIQEALAIIRCRDVFVRPSEDWSLKKLEKFWFELDRYIETLDGVLDLDYLEKDLRERCHGRA